MSCWIRVAQRIVQDVCVPIQRLRVPRLRHDGVRLDEAAHDGIIPPAVVKVQIGVVLDPLAGEAVVRVERAILVAVDAEGHVALFALAGVSIGTQRQCT